MRSAVSLELDIGGNRAARRRGERAGEAEEDVVHDPGELGGRVRGEVHPDPAVLDDVVRDHVHITEREVHAVRWLGAGRATEPVPRSATRHH